MDRNLGWGENSVDRIVLPNFQSNQAHNQSENSINTSIISNPSISRGIPWNAKAKIPTLYKPMQNHIKKRAQLIQEYSKFIQARSSSFALFSFFYQCPMPIPIKVETYIDKEYDILVDHYCEVSNQKVCFLYIYK